MKNKKFDLVKISEEMLKLEITQTDNIKDIFEKFFTLMRKHGIKQNNLHGNGLVSSPEWVMCFSFFTSRILSFIEMSEFFTNVPDDLKNY